MLVWRSSQPGLAVLGRVNDRFEFADIRLNLATQTFPGLLMLRPNNGIFFVNAEGLREAILHEVQASSGPLRAVLIDLAATNELDAPSAEALTGLLKDLQGQQLSVMLTRVSDSVRGGLVRSSGSYGNGVSFYASIVEALVSYLSADNQLGAIDEIVKSGIKTVQRLAPVYHSLTPSAVKSDS